MFSDNYIALCSREGKHITTVAEEIGYSRTSGIKWANGSIPRKATLKKIADYFSVTIDNLLSDNEKTAPLAGAGMTKAQQELIKLISSLSDQEIAVLESTAKALIASRKSQGDS